MNGDEKYDGYFENNKRSGDGVIENKLGIAKGYFSNNKLNG